MAITEGVFLRGSRRWAAASRRPGGDIAVVTGVMPTWYRQWEAVPFARGVVALAESLSVGVRALLWSGAVQRGAATAAHPIRVRRWQLLANLAPALVISVVLFFVVPAAIGRGVVGHGSGVIASLVETAVRIALVLGYLGAVRRIGQVRRLFRNHGAEHKVVALHEAGLAPTLDDARWQPTSHPRCGTTFFVIVVFVSAFAHIGLAALGDAPLQVLLAGRAALVPLAAAAAYEVLLLVERSPVASPQRSLLRPGLWLQSLTVAEPDDAQLEVALAALVAACAPVAGGEPAPALVGAPA